MQQERLSLIRKNEKGRGVERGNNKTVTKGRKQEGEGESKELQLEVRISDEEGKLGETKRLRRGINDKQEREYRTRSEKKTI